MKKLWISLISMFSILASTTMVAVAGGEKLAQKLSVHFTENNTLVVAAPSLREARLFDEEGDLLGKENGKRVTFILDKGTYVLYADVETGTEVRKVVIR